MSTSVASVTKFFPSAQNGFTTTLASTISSGAATVPLNSVSGYTNGDTAVFVVDPTDTTKKQTFTGVIDTAGVQVTGVIWTAGTNQSHTAGSTVVDYATATHISMITKGILVDHSITGGHEIATNFDPSNPTLETQKWVGVASAVNELTVTNAATGNPVLLAPTGGDTAINLNLKGKGLAKTVTIGAGATTIFPYDYVVSGCVITADSAGVNKNWSMTAGVVVINGNPITVAAVTASVATASKDTYVDVLDNGDGTGLLVITGGNIVNNNAASPALASNSVRLGIIVCGAASIAAAASINQGQEDRVLPIASSIPYAVTDSLGNLICPRDPHRKVLGYRQIISTFTAGASTLTDVTGLNSTVIVPTARKIRVKFWAPQIYSSVDADRHDFKLYEDGNLIQSTYNRTWSNVNGGNGGYILEKFYTPTAGTHTYKMAVVRGSGTGVASVFADASSFAFITVDLT